MRRRWYWHWGLQDPDAGILVRGFGLFSLWKPSERMWAMEKRWRWGWWHLD